MTRLIKGLAVPCTLAWLLLACDDSEILDALNAFRHTDGPETTTPKPPDEPAPFQLQLSTLQAGQTAKLTIRDEGGNSVPPSSCHAVSNEEGLLLSVARRPARYQLTLTSGDENHRTIRQSFRLRVDGFQQLTVSFPKRVDIDALLGSGWEYKGKSYALAWLDQHPRPAGVAGSSPTPPNRVDALHIQQDLVLWGQVDGTLSYGRIANNRINWIQRYRRTAAFDNTAPITSLAVRHGLVYLGTYGNGLFIGRLHPDRIEWLSHSVPPQSRYLTSIVTHPPLIVVGTDNAGLVLGSQSGAGIRWHEQDFSSSQRGPERIGLIRAHDDLLVWHVLTRGLFTARLNAEGRLLSPPAPLAPPSRTPLAFDLSAHRLLLSSPTIALQLVSVNNPSWQTDSPTLPPPAVVVLDRDLVLTGGQDGLHLGRVSGEQIHWQQHFNRQHLGGLPDERVWGLAHHRRLVLVGTEQGLAMARVKAQHQWKYLNKASVPSLDKK